ncbi:hypothetical protein Tco_0704132 [Tanacetum coccineum]|uniref:C2H2-type domain-containing protein n=1 Tax=Tanacetum coccineum TaxID=301880 RepID=A0ABQ4Y199_9ASTR
MAGGRRGRRIARRNQLADNKERRITQPYRKNHQHNRHSNNHRRHLTNPQPQQVNHHQPEALEVEEVEARAGMIPFPAGKLVACFICYPSLFVDKIPALYRHANTHIYTRKDGLYRCVNCSSLFPNDISKQAHVCQFYFA